jgi:purine-cytosine permease-like protein
LIGYWTIIFITITLEEELIFHRGKRGYKWEQWNDQKALPVGIAAFTSFLIGWAGAIVCMSQAYYVGPIAAMIPGDIGLPVAAAWAAVSYPGLRVSNDFKSLSWFLEERLIKFQYLELRKFGR